MNYLWEYSDGTSYSGYNPVPKTFIDYGAKSVTLKIFNNCKIDGLTKSFFLTAPMAQFSGFNDAAVDNSGENRFTISPNPSTSGVFNISAYNNLKSYNYTVQDALGNVIIQGSFNGSNKNVVDLASQSDGIYFIKIKGEAGYQTVHKLIKQ